MKLKGKVALITGSSSGIGESTALLFAKEGAKVVVNSRKNVRGGKSVVEKIKKAGGKAIFVQADVSDPKQVKKLFREAVKKYKTIDILVNNAGDAQSGELDDMKLWDYQWKNIFISTVLCTNEFIKLSKKGEFKKITNISSLYGLFETGNPDYFQYSAAKAAMNSLTKNLAKKLGPDILVNAIAPGWTWTPAWKGTSENKKEKRKSLTRIKRFIEPEEIAHVAVMLAENDSITGQIIVVDGGASLVMHDKYD